MAAASETRHGAGSAALGGSGSPAELEPGSGLVPPAGAAAPAAPLPVVDLIGLRFSLQHLRLVGYGLLAVWGSEIVNLLTSPKLAEIGTRLHYTSQFLDLSPILLVAIGLIAFQGGLRRRPLELALLPLLLALLPLLSGLHFFLAPVSVANVVTLVQKQQQIGVDQLERIDQQIDRASAILRDSASIDSLLEGLQRIPGLQVRVPPKASVSEARQEVRRSLERERDRLRERIEGNLAASREAFLRRAGTNAVLALLVGLLLWGLHHGAMREMEQSIPFLSWMLVHGDGQQQEALQELLRFQRACVTLGWFSLLERCQRRVLRVVRRPGVASPAEPPSPGPTAVQPPPNPFAWSPPRPGRRSGSLPPLARLRPPLVHVAGFETADGATAADAASAHLLSQRLQRRQAAAERREQRRRQRDLNRYRALRQRMERDGRDPLAVFVAVDAAVGDPADPAVGADALSPAQRRRLQRDHQRARDALARMAQSEDLQGLATESQDVLLERQLSEELRQLQMGPAPPPPRGLAGLWHWFVTHI